MARFPMCFAYRDFNTEADIRSSQRESSATQLAELFSLEEKRLDRSGQESDRRPGLKIVSTRSLGYFFIEVEGGRNYIVSVNSKRYRFSTIPLSVNGDISDIDFIGLE